MNTSNTKQTITFIDRTQFKGLPLTFKKTVFPISDLIRSMVIGYIESFHENGLVYQLDKDRVVPTDIDKTATMRTIVVVLPIKVYHKDPDLNYIIAFKLTRIYKRDETSWERLIKAEVQECLQKHIFVQLCRVLQNTYYQIEGENLERIDLDVTRYNEIIPVDAEQVLEFHESGFVWLKEEYRKKFSTHLNN